jgi:hypothetical protein
MTHPIGTVGFRTGLLAVASGALLFGAGMWAGRTLERQSWAPPPPTTACDCQDADDDDVNVNVNLNVAVDDLYRRAQDAYVHGEYQLARRLSRTDGSEKAWRIYGASSCFLRDATGAREAWSHLDTPGRQFLRYVCSRNLVLLP